VNISRRTHLSPVATRAFAARKSKALHTDAPNESNVTTPRSRLLAWHGFQCRVPAAWEITAFSTNPERGRLILSTRDGVSAEVSWRRLRAPPDIPRIHAEIHRRWRESTAALQPRGDSSAAALVHAERGSLVLSHGSFDEPTHASAVLGERTLVHWMFFRDRDHDVVLDSLASNDTDPRRCAAWSIDVALPARFELAEAEPLPANVTLRFTDVHHHSIILQRWGLASHLLAARSPVEFLASVLHARDRRDIVTSAGTFRGHAAASARFKTAGEAGFDKYLGRHWPGTALLWHDATANRLNLCEQFHPRKCTPLDPDAVVSTSI